MNDNENKGKSKSLVLLILGIIILIIGVFGVSYAAIYYSKLGEKVNNVSTGTLTMSYSENTNGINLTDANATSDSVGMAMSQENEYFDFTVSATMSGSTTVDYVIVGSKDTSSTLPDNAIKVYLTEVNGDSERQVVSPTKISELDSTDTISYVPDNQYVLLQSNFNKTTSCNYRLRMWIADDFNMTVGSYTFRINVYGNMSA